METLGANSVQVEEDKYSMSEETLISRTRSVSHAKKDSALNSDAQRSSPYIPYRHLCTCRTRTSWAHQDTDTGATVLETKIVANMANFTDIDVE